MLISISSLDYTHLFLSKIRYCRMFGLALSWSSLYSTNLLFHQEISSLLICPHSFFAILCVSVSKPKACRASGRGLQPRGLRVGQTADFMVDTSRAGPGDLEVHVTGPGESPPPPSSV